jgi:HEAT repeat protein
MKYFLRLIILFAVLSLLGIPGVESYSRNSNDTVEVIKAELLSYPESELIEPDLVVRMLNTLKSVDPFVRAEAVQVLGEVGDSRALGALIAALRDDNVFVRAYAAEALGKLKDEKTAEALISLLKDEEIFVQFYAIEALAELKAERAVDALIVVLQEGDPDVRAHAAWALGIIKKERAVKHLITALKDESCGDKAAEALEQITDKDFGVDYNDWLSWWIKRNSPEKKKQY